MPARSESRVATRFTLFVAALLSFGLHERAAASVTSLGSVNPIPPSSGGTFTGTWTIGDDDATNPDIRALANITNGTSLQYGSLVIGDEEGFQGELNVLGDFLTGVNTQLTLSASDQSGNPTVQVGLEGTGRLNIRGATMTLTNNFSDMSIGIEPTGVGNVSISEPFTLVTLSENLIVGDQGMGHLEVLNGAWLQTTDTGSNDAITIGSTATGIGSVVVDGLGTVLSAGSNLVVGGLGLGTLAINDHAIVDANNQTNRTISVGTLGRIELDGGTLLGLQTNIDGFLGGSGLVRGPVDFRDSSSSDIGPDDILQFDAEVSSHGAFTIEEGELRFLSTFHNHAQGLEDAPGRITLENGTVRFTDPLTNDGVLSSAQGSNSFHGQITNQGYIVVAGYTVATFNDAVTDNGGTIDVLPNGNALFLADLVFQSASMLHLSVGLDEDMLDNSSRVAVAGGATLGGDLSVDMIGSFTPTLGQSFTLITAEGGINGTFDNESLPDIPGTLEFGVLYDANSIRLEVRIEQLSIGLDGDYNNDSTIDGLDYSVWRDALTAASSFLLNDPTPGSVDESDFLYWRAHYGETPPFGAGAGTVPEPSSAFLAGVLFFGLTSGFLRRPQL